MTLIKTGLLNSIAVVIKVLTLLGLEQASGCVRRASRLCCHWSVSKCHHHVHGLTAGAVSNGVVKYTAEHYEEEARQHDVWRTAGTLTLGSTVLLGVLIALFSRSLAGFFLGDEHADVFQWFAAGLLFYAFNVLLLAILNGKKEVPSFVIANIAGSLLSLLLVYVLVSFMGLKGALIGFAVFQSVAFCDAGYLLAQIVVLTGVLTGAGRQVGSQKPVWLCSYGGYISSVCAGEPYIGA